MRASLIIASARERGYQRTSGTKLDDAVFKKYRGERTYRDVKSVCTMSTESSNSDIRHCPSASMMSENFWLIVEPCTAEV
ncbi:Uncharacterised protein [Chlamydia trachomatis]|nr:Uncharacterised protein [Chlamydia trachomatis]